MKNIYDMYYFLESLENIDDSRQFQKVKYPINEIVGMMLIASLGNANEWTEIAVFCKLYEKLLKKYFKLQNNIPLHDTFQTVMGMIDSKVMEQVQVIWNEYISQNDREGIKKILHIDGKTMRGSRIEDKKPLQAVSVWCDEEGICFA